MFHTKRVSIWRNLVSMLAIVALPGLTILAAAMPGNLDVSFGLHGQVVSHFDRTANVHNIAIQPDGKIVAAGDGSIVGLAGGGILVARYNTDGSLDTSFGTDGKVSTAVSSFGSDGWEVALQPDGKIVVAGQVSYDTFSAFALLRYNADGSLDTAFGPGGIVTTTVGDSTAIGLALAIQPDGKLLVGGYTGSVTFAVARFNTDGSPDMSFGSNGYVTGVGGLGVSLALQPDGKIVQAGSSVGGFTLARYNTDGSLDPLFGSGGTVITSIGGGGGARDVVIQPDGKILATGGVCCTAVPALARYNSDGSLDSSFGVGGTETMAAGQDIKDAVLQADGKIVTVGDVSGADTWIVTRYNPDGSLDGSFGIGGMVNTGFGLQKIITVWGIALQADGRIVAAGESDTLAGPHHGTISSVFALARYLP